MIVKKWCKKFILYTDRVFLPFSFICQQDAVFTQIHDAALAYTDYVWCRVLETSVLEEVSYWAIFCLDHGKSFHSLLVIFVVFLELYFLPHFEADETICSAMFSIPVSILFDDLLSSFIGCRECLACLLIPVFETLLEVLS